MSRPEIYEVNQEFRDVKPIWMTESSTRPRSYSTQKMEELSFFGPSDPSRWPIHKIFFLCGLLFPPLWYVGSFTPVRDTDDNWSELFKMRCQAAAIIVTIILVAVIVIEIGLEKS